jgi:flagellin-specific chaperone FliS
MQPKGNSSPGRKPRRAVDSASPLQLVGMAYDRAILACRRADAGRAEKAIGLVREVMNSLGPDDATELMASYDWCLDRVRKGEFAPAEQMLADLREAWRNSERASLA